MMLQTDEIIDKDEVLKMARQAQVHEELCGEHFIYEFAKLVAAQATAKAVKREREACAKVCENLPAALEEFDALGRAADAIRARGEA